MPVKSIISKADQRGEILPAKETSFWNLDAPKPNVGPHQSDLFFSSQTSSAPAVRSGSRYRP